MPRLNFIASQFKFIDSDLNPLAKQSKGPKANPEKTEDTSIPVSSENSTSNDGTYTFIILMQRSVKRQSESFLAKAT